MKTRLTGHYWTQQDKEESKSRKAQQRTFISTDQGSGCLPRGSLGNGGFWYKKLQGRE
jgi:hypothetical protein